MMAILTTSMRHSGQMCYYTDKVIIQRNGQPKAETNDSRLASPIRALDRLFVTPNLYLLLVCIVLTIDLANT